MKIAVIGKLNPSLAYEVWASMLQANVAVSTVTQFNITAGNGILNQYVRQCAQSHNLSIAEYAPDFKTYGDEARIRRNEELVGNSDLIVGFLPKGSSKESWISRPGISCEKKAIVIYCPNNPTSNPKDIEKVIMREPSNADLESLEAINHEELISVEDEVELVKQIQRAEGDVEATKEKLMRANQRFVRAVAQRYAGKMFTLEELLTRGNIGLEHAIYKFDEARGFKFITYAVWWIRQSIEQAIVMKARAESELKGLSERELDILRMYFGFGGEKASLDEIGARYGLSTQRAVAIKNQALRKLFKSKEKLGKVRDVLLGNAENHVDKSE